MHIGTKLYNYVIDFARKSGCYNVTLNVWAGNDGAMKFYERIGFKVQKNRYGNNSLKRNI